MTDETKIKELKRIAKKNGGVLEPSKVVEAARDSASPLHDYFEWDDSEAAERYRIWQARQLIRVTVEYLPGTERLSHVFVSLTPDRKEGGYRTTVDVLGDEDMRSQLLADALADMERFRKKYRDLKELVTVFDAMVEAVPIVKKATKSVSTAG